MLARRVFSLEALCSKWLGASCVRNYTVKSFVSASTYHENGTEQCTQKPGVIPSNRWSRLQIRRYSVKSDDISQKIEKMVQSNKIVVFMKGVPEQPMCGFSNAVVQVLRMHGVEEYDAHNVLEDEDLRQGIKDYSDWPTIPQVYFNGEFVGGCDILLQMHQSGDLIEELKTLGMKSALEK